MNYYDRRTIGRFPPRIQSLHDPDDDVRPRRADDEPFFLFFDGKSFTPHSLSKRSSADPFTGYGVTAATLRPGKLLQKEWDFARAYVLCEYAFRCVEMVASDITAIKHGVRNRQTKEDMPNHPLMQALAWARRTNYQDIVSLWEKSLYIWGETYILPVSNTFTNIDTGQPYYGGIQWLNPLVTEPYIPYNQLEGFEYTAFGMHRFRRNEVVFDKRGSMFDDLRGQSPMSVALASVNIDIEIKRYTLDQFLKDMRFSAILTGRQGSTVSEQELEATLARLKEQRDSRMIALAAALEVSKVQNEFSETHLKASDDARGRIAAALDIPVSVAGAWFSATYQSAPAQILFYYDHTIFRECDRLELFLNEVVLPYYDPWGEGEWYFDKDSVMALIEDRAAKISMVNSRQAAGNLTINQARVQLGDEPIEGGDVFTFPAGTVIVPQDKLLDYAARQAQQIAAMPTATPSFAPMAIDALAALPTPQPKPGGKSASVMLTVPALPDNADLIGLQRDVQALYGDIPVEWNEPDSFHITLLTAPSVTDEQIAAMTAALEDVDVPELRLNIGSLRVFKKLNENAIVFFIRRSTDLIDYQEMLYEMFAQLGIPMNNYSVPEEYQPHITMGYTTEPVQGVTYKTRLRVKPVALRLSVDKETVYERAVGEEVEPPVEDEPEDDDASDEAALDELKAWRKKADNHGSAKAAKFVCHVLPDDIQTLIRDGLKPGMEWKGVVALFDLAEEALKARPEADVLTENGFLELVNVWGELGMDWLVGEDADGSSDQSQPE